MHFVIDLFSDPITVLVILTCISALIFTIFHFNISVTDLVKNGVDVYVGRQLKVDNDKAKRREQLNKLGKRQPIIIQKYRMAVTSIKIALGLTFLSVENFTTIFILFGVVVFIVASILLNNIFFGLFIAIPSIFAFLAFLLVITKKKIRANDNAVMDALDAICPVINVGVVNAIKQSKDSFSRRVSHHFDWFLGAIEFKGYDFNEAIDELTIRLGPRFNEFANKAKIFEEHYKDGMEDIFKDIIEQNNDVRTDNAELDEIFRKKNTDLLVISMLLVAFLAYMYMIPLTREFMLNHFMGTLTTTLEVSMLILIYAVSQLLQIDIPETEEEKLKKGK